VEQGFHGLDVHPITQPSISKERNLKYKWLGLILSSSDKKISHKNCVSPFVLALQL